jgi:glycerophosphoryl diester phosphodiesterase
MRAAIDVGTPAIELDVLLTADAQVVVWHDPVLLADKCRSTATDYTGARVDELTLAQLRTIDVGSSTLAAYPRQRPAPGERIPTLAEVFAATDDADVWWVIEVKVDPTDPRERATRNALLDGVLATVTQAGVRERAFIHSFDWAVLERSREIDPQLPRSALAVVDRRSLREANGWARCAGRTIPTTSPGRQPNLGQWSCRPISPLAQPIWLSGAMPAGSPSCRGRSTTRSSSGVWPPRGSTAW